MSIHRPQNLTELEQAIGTNWAFSSSAFGLQGNTSFVLTSTKHLQAGEPFADMVIESQGWLTARYTLTGSRSRLPGEVLYYLTSGARVVAYVTAGGEYAIDNTGLTPKRLRAIHAGIQKAVARIPSVFGDEIAPEYTGAGCCENFGNCGH